VSLLWKTAKPPRRATSWGRLCGSIRISQQPHDNLGNAFRLLGERDNAVAAFRRAVEAERSYGEAHSNLGQLLLERLDVASALERCRRAAALLPNLAYAHKNLGNALREAGYLAEAKRSYAHALRLDQHNAMILGNIAQAL
jgi:tetratricopeptide (TPR) repeat protein